MLVGGALGILFVTLLRRVMVEDLELPFPESIAASEIHKAGQQGRKAAKLLSARWVSARESTRSVFCNCSQRAKNISSTSDSSGPAWCASDPRARPALLAWAASPPSQRPLSARPTSASDTSSDRAWPR